MTEHTPVDVVEQLRRTLGDRVSNEALRAVAEAVTEEHLRLQPDRPRVIDRSLFEPGVRYAIHDADLKLIDEAAGIAGGLWALTSNPLPVLGKLVGLLYRLRRKRARLEADAALVLLALRDAPPRGWTISDLKEHLATSYATALDGERIATLLGGLRKVRLPDNTRTDFADEQGGRWFAVDV